MMRPYLTEQWYVNARELATPALAAVREGKPVRPAELKTPISSR